ncbi:glycosyltransferase family 2 protein [Flavihumibacter rivuli]|uniref:glycosyltransferase n=1 Tax=Flavihumibacter rivuli TaxID=2838156 RepID=UPI001BDE1E1D|nr:glycosyltransferase [Flavihumibacter rivuli]ULQ56245.1 glycosyltransferase family 2 protein [Flavihumibacter rivuli]
MAEAGKGVTVVICCFNSAARLGRTIEHLAEQKLRPGFPMEVIVVNNASEDTTFSLAKELLAIYFPSGNCKVVEEPTPGLSFARKKGIDAAAYDYVLFCDDDNWLEENYVQRSFDFMESRLDVAILGGRSIGVYESDPPEWFEKVKVSYAIGEQAQKEGAMEAVWGAGMTVRKQVYQQLFAMGFTHLNSDRYKDKLFCGGDTEICYAIARMGYLVWYHPGLVLRHYIPRVRLQHRYARRLFFYIGYASPSIAVYLRETGDFKEGSYKGSWVKALTKSMARLVITLLSSGERVQNRVGYSKDFMLEVEKGRILRLLQLKGKYIALRRKVLEAQWNGARPTPQKATPPVINYAEII